MYNNTMPNGAHNYYSSNSQDMFNSNMPMGTLPFQQVFQLPPKLRINQKSNKPKNIEENSKIGNAMKNMLISEFCRSKLGKL